MEVQVRMLCNAEGEPMHWHRPTFDAAAHAVGLPEGVGDCAMPETPQYTLLAYVSFDVSHVMRILGEI